MNTFRSRGRKRPHYSSPFIYYKSRLLDDGGTLSSRKRLAQTSGGKISRLIKKAGRNKKYNGKSRHTICRGGHVSPSLFYKAAVFYL
ncbi:hypothetical protein [Bacillus benzoevorans]|uniref:Uncharacterized protein n=1 Tax=Bacillus benzoevorans TaxID=1456 RepID=A0A7X0LWG9_9BACI|nr:hypothetical protein [Bacillus benzoevorans]